MLTDDPNDLRLSYGVDDEVDLGHLGRFVLSEEERAQGLVRPVRRTYVLCRQHRPVGADGEFVWDDGTKVGT